MDGRAGSIDLILDYFAEVSAFELLDGMDARLTLGTSQQVGAGSPCPLPRGFLFDCLQETCAPFALRPCWERTRHGITF